MALTDAPKILASRQVDYHVPTTLSDRVTVTCAVERFGHTSTPMAHIIRADGSDCVPRRPCRWSSMPDSGAAAPVPEEFRELLKS